MAASLALAATLEAVDGPLPVVNVLGFSQCDGRVTDVLGFVTLGAGAATLLGASRGVAILIASGLVDAGLLVSVWGMWWLGSVGGALLAAPVLLTWGTPADTHYVDHQGGEIAGLIVALAAIGYAVYGGVFPTEISAGLLYAIFPLLIWAAVRLGPRGAVTLELLITAISLWGTTSGMGPFARASSYRSLVSLDGFLAATTIATMLLAAAISERQKAQEAALRSEQKLRSVIRQSGDAIILADADGGISEWNLSAERLLGWPREAVLSRPVWDVFYDLTPPELRTGNTLADLRAEAETVLGDAAMGASRPLSEAEILSPRGERRAIQSLSFAIGTERGPMLGLIIRDVTARRRADQPLREQAARWPPSSRTCRWASW